MHMPGLRFYGTFRESVNPGTQRCAHLYHARAGQRGAQLPNLKGAFSAALCYLPMVLEEPQNGPQSHVLLRQPTSPRIQGRVLGVLKVQRSW